MSLGILRVPESRGHTTTLRGLTNLGPDVSTCISKINPDNPNQYDKWLWMDMTLVNEKDTWLERIPRHYRVTPVMDQ
jgi:hypothetical protein